MTCLYEKTNDGISHRVDIEKDLERGIGLAGELTGKHLMQPRLGAVQVKRRFELEHNLPDALGLHPGHTRFVGSQDT